MVVFDYCCFVFKDIFECIFFEVVGDFVVVYEEMVQLGVSVVELDVDVELDVEIVVLEIFLFFDLLLLEQFVVSDVEEIVQVEILFLFYDLMDFVSEEVLFFLFYEVFEEELFVEEDGLLFDDVFGEVECYCEDVVD